MELPTGRTVTRVELLRAETNILFHAAAGKIEFTIPKILDYELAAIHSA
jgi:hypothetical protein